MLDFTVRHVASGSISEIVVRTESLYITIAGDRVVIRGRDARTILTATAIYGGDLVIRPTSPTVENEASPEPSK